MHDMTTHSYTVKINGIFLKTSTLFCVYVAIILENFLCILHKIVADMLCVIFEVLQSCVQTTCVCTYGLFAKTAAASTATLPYAKNGAL